MKKLIKLFIAITQALAALFYIGILNSLGRYFVSDNKNEYLSYVLYFFIGALIIQSLSLYFRKKYPNELESVQTDHKKNYVWIAIIVAIVFVLAFSIPIIIGILQ